MVCPSNRRSASLACCGLLATSLLLLPTTAAAQGSDEAQLRRQVAEALASLPPWDARALTQKSASDWIAGLSFEEVLRAVGEEVAADLRLPEGARVLEGPDRVVLLDPERGVVRYIGRSRAWRFETDFATTAVEGSRAVELVGGVLEKLGVPREELGEPEVVTQRGTSVPRGKDTPPISAAMYRVVTLRREIAGVRVEGSRILAAVSNRGEVQRLRIVWPALRLEPNLALGESRSLEARAVQEILARKPGSPVEIRAHLAYVPQNDRKAAAGEMRLVPSVVFSVVAPPSPFQLAVPVAGEEADRPLRDR